MKQPKIIQVTALLVLMTGFTVTLFAAPFQQQQSYSYDQNQKYGPWRNGQNLGEVHFTHSETVTDTSRSNFLTGLKLLHAFEYPEARAAFRQAQDNNTDPFVMALWGELMCNYQILWYSRNFTVADTLLSQLNAHIENLNHPLNESEKTLINAARKLFGSSGRNLLPHQVGSNIEQFYRTLDNALSQKSNLQSEVLVFHQLARLATRQSIHDYDHEKMVISDIRALLSQPDTVDHPGLRHYLIHAGESPFLARSRITDLYLTVKWLEALNTDSNTTSSIHLTHMPTHFYFAWGDWAKVTSINTIAWEKSLQRKSDLNNAGQIPAITDASLALHEHLWLVYSLLQQGDWDQAWNQAEDLYDRIVALQRSGSEDLQTMKTYHAFERAYLQLELPKGDHRIATIQSRSFDDSDISSWGMLASRFMETWNALQNQNYDVAQEAFDKLTSIRSVPGFDLDPAQVDGLPVLEQILTAEKLRQQGDLTSAIATIESTRESYENMRWGHGVPTVIKPMYEYLGELYLQAAGYTPLSNGDEPIEVQSAPSAIPTQTIILADMTSAVSAFQKELTDYFPRRRRSLEGLASATKSFQPAIFDHVTAELQHMNTPLDFSSYLTSLLSNSPIQSSEPDFAIIHLPSYLLLLFSLGLIPLSLI